MVSNSSRDQVKPAGTIVTVLGGGDAVLTCGDGDTILTCDVTGR